MNNSPLNKQEKALDSGFTQVGLFSLLVSVLKLFQMIVFHEEKTNMLMQNGIVTALNWTIALVVVLMLYCAVKTGLALSAAGPPASSREKLPPVIGFGLLGVGVFFLVQAALDLAAVLSRGFDFLPWAQTVFCLLSAVAFFRMGYQVSSHGAVSGNPLDFAPLVWGLLTVVRLLISYASTVSYQSDMVRTMIALLGICFITAVIKWLSGDPAVYQPVSMVICAAYPGLSLAASLPYVLLFPFGVRDAIATTPYFAQLGLALFGFFTLLCLAVNAVIRLEARRR